MRIGIMALSRLRLAVALCVSAATAAGYGARAAAQGTTAAPTARRFRDVTISPDGKYVAWVGAVPSGSASRPGLVIIDRARGLSSAVTVDVKGAHGLSWSRDGHTLVFLGANPAADTTTGVYMLPAGSTTPRMVAAVAGSVREPALSPDASHIAVLYSAPNEE